MILDSSKVPSSTRKRETKLNLEKLNLRSKPARSVLILIVMMRSKKSLFKRK